MFDKITSRIKKLCYGLSDRYVDPVQITMKAISGIIKHTLITHPNSSWNGKIE